MADNRIAKGTYRGNRDYYGDLALKSGASFDVESGATLESGGSDVTAGLTNSVKKVIQLAIDDVSTASTGFAVAPNYAGTISKVSSVIDGTIATADAVVTVSIAGTPVTDGGFTIGYSGSAAGDKDTATPTALNTFTAGQVISATTSGASTNTVKSVITLDITPS